MLYLLLINVIVWASVCFLSYNDRKRLDEHALKAYERQEKIKQLNDIANK